MTQSWMIFLVETIIIVLLGSLLHFTYAWSKENEVVGIFSAVNESTWEHIKLALSAIFACMLVDVWFLGSNHNYWCARSISFLVPVIVVPVLFYGYRAITGYSVLVVDILIFVIAAIASEAVFVMILNAPPVGSILMGASMVISVIILVLYLLLTKFPMHNFLFEDPITHRYGYDGHAGPRKLVRKHK